MKNVPIDSTMWVPWSCTPMVLCVWSVINLEFSFMKSGTEPGTILTLILTIFLRHFEIWALLLSRFDDLWYPKATYSRLHGTALTFSVFILSSQKFWQPTLKRFKFKRFHVLKRLKIFRNAFSSTFPSNQQTCYFHQVRIQIKIFSKIVKLALKIVKIVETNKQISPNFLYKLWNSTPPLATLPNQSFTLTVPDHKPNLHNKPCEISHSSEPKI